MARAVGLSRNIKLAWLNKAATLYGENLTKDQYKEAINNYLAFEISSPTNLRKTREILMQIWFYSEDHIISANRAKAYELLCAYADCAVEIHWCMLLLVYPVFADICKLTGRIADFNETVILKQLKQKLYDEWGERSTLYHSTDKIITTMKDLGVISADKPGVYHIICREVKNDHAVMFLLYTAMKVDGGSYYSFNDLNSFNSLFPFRYNISEKILMEQDSLSINNLGGELTVSLKDD